MNNRAQIAEEHTALMSRMFSEEIAQSIEDSDVVEDEEYPYTEIIVRGITSEQAVVEYGGEATFLLNFASYTRPGGGFITGAIAQEESLCHSSNLYNILEHFKHEYDNNFQKEDRKTGAYRNWGIYSPNVKFLVNDNECIANVFTCPAPNATQSVQNDLLYETILSDRIRFILDRADEFRDSTLILGAFGCGVFGNDPLLVAKMFKFHLRKYNFKTVVFAIPGGPNLQAFKTVFENEK